MKEIIVGTIWLKQRDHTKWIENYQSLDWCGLKPKFYIQPAENGYNRREAIKAGKAKDKNVCKNYNFLREAILKEKADYILLWEDDVFVPKDTLKICLKQKADAVGVVLKQWYQPMIDDGIKYGSWKGKWAGPFPYGDASEEGKWELLYDEKTPNICGLGFVLMKRRVL